MMTREIHVSGSTFFTGAFKRSMTGVGDFQFTASTRTNARSSPRPPAMRRVEMLLSILTCTHLATVPLSLTGSGIGLTDQQVPTSVVGAMATTGASMPAKFKQVSSQGLRPLYTMSAKPTTIMVPTKIARTGV